MKSLDGYRESDQERERTEDLMRLLPCGRCSVLDIGARDGHFSRLLTEYFPKVTALDVQEPRFEFEGVKKVVGDITQLEFPDNSFDCVFCAEVLEHIGKLDLACKELIRVARHEIVIGVPYKQDTRVGRTTCHSCGRTNPPWGHVNVFDDARLQRLFSGTEMVKRSFVGRTSARTSSIASLLMQWAGNPWGTYSQEEACVHCGNALIAPQKISLRAKIVAASAHRLNRAQAFLSRTRPIWIHTVFLKRRTVGHQDGE